ncbi:MAG: UTRA domain-containing protein, partial [Ruthenibacterium sp.]
MKLCPNLHTLIYEDTSLYNLYENHYGLKMGHISLSIEAELVRPEVQNALKLKANAPMLKMRSTMYLEDERPLYFVESNHIGGKYLFTTTIPRRAPGGTM